VIDYFAAKASQLLVTLFDFLIERLIFNLELFIVDEMQSFGKLFSFLEHFLLVLKTVSQGDVLQTVLMDFLVLGFIGLFPLLDNFCLELLSSAAVNSIHCYRAFKLFELLFNLGAFCLLLVKLVLQFTCHPVVTILSFFKVVAHLMNVRQSVEVLVLKQHLVSVLLILTI